MKRLLWIGSPFFSDALSFCGWDAVARHNFEHAAVFGWHDLVSIAGFEPDAQTMRAIEQGTGQPVRKGQEQEGRPARTGSGRPGQARQNGRPGEGQKRSAPAGAGNGNGARSGKPAAEGGRRAPQRAPDRHANQTVKPHGNK